jgi:hypothetical protein
LAAFDTTINTNNATAFNPAVNGGPSYSYQGVAALELGINVLYVGGFFTAIAGAKRSMLGSVNTTTNTNNVTTFNVIPDGAVYSLLLYGTNLIVGGDFWNTAVTPGSNFLSAFDITQPGSSAGYSFGVNCCTVNTLARVGTKLYVGGNFSAAGGQQRNRIFEWDLTKFSNGATSWNPGAGAMVNSMQVRNGVAYVGGSFTTLGGQTRSNLGAVFLNKDVNNLAPWFPNANNTVYASAPHGTSVVWGGDFTSVGGSASRVRTAETSTCGP